MPVSYTAPAIVTLANLRNIRMSRGITPGNLADITGIDLERIRALDSGNDRVAVEPFLHEAYQIARALNTNGIMPLITDCPIIDYPTDYDPFDDLEVWRSGAKLPISFAIRLAVRFGLPDPYPLIDVDPSQTELMTVLASGERTSGICPWCSSLVGDVGHRPTCAIGWRWVPRGREHSPIRSVPRPREPGKQRKSNRVAPMLRAIRTRKGFTQAKVASGLGVHPQHFARWDQGARNFPLHHAEKLAILWNLPVDLFYAPAGTPIP